MHTAATKGWQRWYKTTLLLSDINKYNIKLGFKMMNKLINILGYYSIRAMQGDPL